MCGDAVAAGFRSAFRTSKTVELEMRPIHVCLATRTTRTRGHAFVVMMAYRIVQELSIRWQQLDITVEEGINELSSLCAIDVLFLPSPEMLILFFLIVHTALRH